MKLKVGQTVSYYSGTLRSRVFWHGEITAIKGDKVVVTEASGRTHQVKAAYVTPVKADVPKKYKAQYERSKLAAQNLSQFSRSKKKVNS